MQKDFTIKDMGSQEEGGWVWRWAWRREFFGREIDAFNSLSSMLESFRPTLATEDGWRWRVSPDGKYNTKSAYIMLSSAGDSNQDVVDEAPVFKLLWKSFAPPKAIATAWRVMWDRLPTRDNLRKRRVIGSVEESMCVLCGENVETASHVFIECNKTRDVWSAIYSWWNISVALHYRVREHFLHNSGLLIGIKGSKVASTLWICTSWVVWKWRNEVIFGSACWNKEKIVDEIKSRLWSWCLMKNIFLHYFPFKEWMSNPKQFFRCS